MGSVLITEREVVDVETRADFFTRINSLGTSRAYVDLNNPFFF